MLLQNQVLEFVFKNIGQGVAVSTLFGVCYLLFRYIYFLHGQINKEREALAKKEERLEKENSDFIKIIVEKNWQSLDFVKLIEKIITNSKLDKEELEDVLKKLFHNFPLEIKKKILEEMDEEEPTNGKNLE